MGLTFCALASSSSFSDWRSTGDELDRNKNEASNKIMMLAFNMMKMIRSFSFLNLKNKEIKNLDLLTYLKSRVS